MSLPDVAADALPRRTWAQRFPIYYGWVCVLLAALAMTATLPGRTHGLGLITEPLLVDLSLERTTYARINLVCTLLGAAFCLPIGWMIDSFGVRRMLTFVVAGLAAAVLLMSRSTAMVEFTFSLLLVRGLGQGALSVISMAIIGKWFQQRVGPAMGLFAVLLTFGFIASILGMGGVVETRGWRTAWMGLGFTLAVFAPLCWVLARDTPEACGLQPDGMTQEVTTREASPTQAAMDFTWMQSLQTPIFWVFAAGTALFNLVWSAITLFNESILAEQGFDKNVAVQMMAILTGSGLIANMIAGRLATRERLGPLLGTGLAILSVSLAAFPQVTTPARLWSYGFAMGTTGGIITVVFFAAWGQLFGRAHLGRIQGTAQVATILASAAGPWILAEVQAATESYHPLFYALAALTGTVAVIAWKCPAPEFALVPVVERHLRPVLDSTVR